MKILSVIIPVYNMEKYIKRCIESLIFKPILNLLEIICINDGSKDTSLSIIKSYAKKYPYTIKYIDKKNAGHGSTINTGIKEAKGIFFKIIDSDDWVNKENFVELIKELTILKNKDVDLIVSPYVREQYFEGNQNIFYYNIPNKKIINFSSVFSMLNKSKSNEEVYFTMASSTYRSSILKNSNYSLSENTPYVDMEFNTFYINHIKNIYYFNKPIYSYFIGRENQTINKKSLINNFFFHEKVLKKIINLYNKEKFKTLFYRQYLEKILLYMINTHYMIQAVFRNFKQQKQGNKLIKSFDKYLKNTSKDLYLMLNNLSYIKKGRKYNFNILFFNIYQYLFERKKDIKKKIWGQFHNIKNKKYDVIIVGAGYSGSILARKFADINKKVLIVEKRNHIAGNMYDYIDEKTKILIHKYGPHISYMNNLISYNFLSQFTEWNKYEHFVNAKIKKNEISLPFNLNALDILFNKNKSNKLKKLLIETYGNNTQIPILKMLGSKNIMLNKLAKYIYKNIFIDYTVKMWGLVPEEISPEVTARIPIRINYNNKHFTTNYQVMPKNGYTVLFNNMLNHKNINILLDTNITSLIKLDSTKKQIIYNNSLFKGIFVYTGSLDELLNYQFGELMYRSLEFKIKTYNVNRVQKTATLNWPDKRPETRRSEMKIITSQEKIKNKSITITEYPNRYNKYGKYWNEPYYPIPNKLNKKKYIDYYNEIIKYKNIFISGRLAEYKYYNMESVVLNSLKLFERINK